MRDTLYLVFIGVFILIAVFGTISSIGYGLYLWGGTGLAFAASAWSAFKLWIYLIGIALISGISAVLLDK